MSSPFQRFLLTFVKLSQSTSHIPPKPILRLKGPSSGLASSLQTKELSKTSAHYNQPLTAKSRYYSDQIYPYVQSAARSPSCQRNIHATAPQVHTSTPHSRTCLQPCKGPEVCCWISPTFFSCMPISEGECCSANGKCASHPLETTLGEILDGQASDRASSPLLCLISDAGKKMAIFVCEVLNFVGCWRVCDPVRQTSALVTNHTTMIQL